MPTHRKSSLSRRLAAAAMISPYGATAQMQQAMPDAATVPESGKAPSNTRYRSFAERYVVERASTFRPGHEEEDAWKAAMSAKTAYNMIREVGRTLKDDT